MGLSDSLLNDNPLRYRPIFVGKTENDEKIVVYSHCGEIHIRRPDGELWALEPDAQVFYESNPINDRYQIQIESNVWTGKAIGTRRDLIEERVLIIDKTSIREE